MKKSFSIIVALTFGLFFSQLSAQFGVRLSANLANASIKDAAESPSFKTGLGAGLFYNLALGGIAVQPEVNFMMQGYNLNTNGSEQKLSLNYLQVPVIVQFTLFDVPGAAIFAELGPYMAVGIGDPKGENCVAGQCVDFELKYGNGDNDINALDFGGMAGLGVKIGSKVVVDVRYLLGITNIAAGGRDVADIKNNGINIGVGYIF